MGAAERVMQRSIAVIRRVSYPARAVMLAAIYFAVAKLSLLVAIPPGYATPVWPPAGIALAATLLFGSRMWPGIWLGAAAVNFTVNSSLLAAVLIAGGNTLEALVGAALVERIIGIPRSFERGGDVVKFVAIAAMSSSLAATVAMVPLVLAHAPNLYLNWWTWWQGDATGIIIVAPLILNWSMRDYTGWPLRKIVEGAVFALSLPLTAYVIFSDRVAAILPTGPLPFVILPFIIWAALRFGQREVTTAIAVVCAIAIWNTVAGRGSFAPAPLNVSLLELLAFISTVVVTGLVLSAVVGERSRAMRSLQEQTFRDPLTQLYNRRFLLEYVPRELSRTLRRNASLAAIMVDLDRFKKINDSSGHAAGDLVLMEVAALLKRHIRGSDIVCRYGGEEFLLIMPDATLESAHGKCQSICDAVKQLELSYRGEAITVTASLGLALFPEHAAEVDSLLRAADKALYEAKRGGRNQVRMVTQLAANSPMRQRMSEADLQ